MGYSRASVPYKARRQKKRADLKSNYEEKGLDMINVFLGVLFLAVVILFVVT